jgi:hypothetical protein
MAPPVYNKLFILPICILVLLTFTTNAGSDVSPLSLSLSISHTQSHIFSSMPSDMVLQMVVDFSGILRNTSFHKTGQTMVEICTIEDMPTRRQRSALQLSQN